MIRPLTEQDGSEVRTLMRSCSYIDTDFNLDFRSVSAYPNLIAELDGHMIGIAIKNHSSSSPRWVEITIIVHPDYRRQNIGTQLHEATLQAKPSHFDIDGWKGSCYQEDLEAIGFMQSLGYKNRLDCHILELDSLDKDKQGLLEWLPVQKQQVWKIFQKPFMKS